MFIEVPSEIKNIRRVSSEILKSLSSLKIGEDKLSDIRLSLEEMVRNAIVHGNNSDKNLSVRINYKIDGNILVIEIEDQGAGFEHGSVPDPTKADNLTRESGRGVYLAKKLMDRVEFIGRGNKVRLEKILMWNKHFP